MSDDMAEKRRALTEKLLESVRTACLENPHPWLLEQRPADLQQAMRRGCLEVARMAKLDGGAPPSGEDLIYCAGLILLYVREATLDCEATGHDHG